MLDVTSVVKQFRDEAVRLSNMAEKYNEMAIQLEGMDGTITEHVMEPTIHFFEQPATKHQTNSRKFSAESIERMRAAQKRRWATFRKQNKRQSKIALETRRANAAKARATRMAKLNLKRLQEAA